MKKRFIKEGFVNLTIFPKGITFSNTAHLMWGYCARCKKQFNYVKTPYSITSCGKCTSKSLLKYKLMGIGIYAVHPSNWLLIKGRDEL